jgi:hypothetical protein
MGRVSAERALSNESAEIIPPGIASKQLLTLDELAALQPNIKSQGGDGKEGAIAAILLCEVRCRNPFG